MDDYTARRPEAKTSETIEGTACDGCSCMEVLVSGRRIKKERYWCSKARRTVEPGGECAIGGK